MRHYCQHCRTNSVAVKQSPNHVLHGILSLLTAGAWLVVWLIAVLNPKWHCRECGTRTYGGYARSMFRNVVLAAMIVAAIVAFAML